MRTHWPRLRPLVALLAVATFLVPTTARASYPDWVAVDSLTVAEPYYAVGVDTVVVEVHLSNPDPSHAYELDAQLVVRQELLEYDWSSVVQSVTIPSQGTAVIPFEWFDPNAWPTLEYDIGARLFFPDSAKSNLVVNGDFEGGLGGWTPVNDNPPGYGVEHTTLADGDGDGEAHVYSTQYNTYGIPAALYQQVDVGGEGYVHLRFRCTTRDLIYGVGLALVYVTRGDGQYIYWYSTAATPPDTPTQKYVRVFDTQWKNVIIPVSAIPGGSGDVVRIGAQTGLLSSFSYASAETDIWLDDVGATIADPTTLESFSAYIVTGLDTQTIGDHEAALQACQKETIPDLGVYEAVIPLVDNIHMWDRLSANVCAASVYQDLGDPLRRDLSLARGAYALLKGPLDVLSSAVPTDAAPLVKLLGSGAVRGAIDGATGAIVGTVDAEQVTWSSLKASIPSVVAEAGHRFGTEFFTRGEVKVAIKAGLSFVKSESLATTTVDTIGITDCFVIEMPESGYAWASVGDSSRVLSDAIPMSQEDPVRFETVSQDDGTIDLYLLSDTVEGVLEAELEGFAVNTGDVVFVDVDETTTVFDFMVDRGGDGSIDESVLVAGRPVYATSVPDEPPVVIRPLRARPNPFNPSTSIEFVLREPVSSDAELGVFDVRGRRVKSWSLAGLPAGAGRKTWDGTDERGARVASGVYQVMLSNGTQRQKTGVVVLK